jgi:hypothetical protein
MCACILVDGAVLWCFWTGASDAEEDDDLDNVDWNAVAMASSDESEADDADDAAAGEKRPLAGM